MNETANANYLNKRFIIKPLFEKNNQVTLFLNEIEAIKNGLSKTNIIPHITKPEFLLSLPTPNETIEKQHRVIDDMIYDNIPPIISPSPSMKSIISNKVMQTNLNKVPSNISVNSNLNKVPSTNSFISYRTTSSLFDPSSIHFMD
jgi:hypothetical protein